MTHDFVEYSGNNLIITRNPFGFVNAKKRGPIKKKMKGGADEEKPVEKAEKMTSEASSDEEPKEEVDEEPEEESKV